MKDPEQAEHTIKHLRKALKLSQAHCQAWLKTAQQNQRNVAYYRGLVVKIGTMMGPDAYRQDDGGRSDAVLCAKVPELVKARLERLTGAITFTQAFLQKLEDGCPAPDPLYAIRRRVHAPLHEKLNKALEGLV